MSIRKVFYSILALAAAFAITAYGGTLTVKFGSAMDVEIDGVVHSFAKNDTFTPTTIPCIYKMRPGDMGANDRTFAITGTDKIVDANFYRMPMYGEGNWVRVALDPYTNVSTTVTLTGIKATGVFYVDAENGDDDLDGTADDEHRDTSTGKGPKKTLKAAYDAVTGSYPIVLAAPGFYSNGVAVASYTTSGKTSTSNRRLVVTNNVAFIATGGATNTFIIGAPDPETGGNGDNAVGGVYMKTSSEPAYLQGFTITGCYSPAASSQAGHGNYGTAFGGATLRAYCLDCIISNNHAATQYPASNYGVILRTKIIDNESPGFLSNNGVFISCVFSRNRVGTDTGYVASGLQTYAHSYFCTYDLRNDTNPDGRKRLQGNSCSYYSGLVIGLTSESSVSADIWHDSRASDNPVFADVGAYDYRLGALSPAIDASSYETDLDDFARRAMTADIDGRMPVYHDGKVRLGAVWNDPPLPVTVLCSEGGGMSVSGASAGTNVVASAGQITVTATDAATRPFIGFEVNGEMAARSVTSYTFTPSLTAGAVNSVKAIYSTDWYVDCVNGNDANSGLEGQPKATIKAATDYAVSGDVIHVAPGTYGAAEGSQQATGTSRIGTRVIVPEGVTLVGTEGAEKTFIVGAAAYDGQIDNAEYGTGTNAVRCVYAKRGSVVRGFTLTGGRGTVPDPACDDTRGAGFFTDSTSSGVFGATVENCIISNNAARSGAIYRAIVKNCLVLENIGLRLDGNFQSPAGYQCCYYGSVIDGNTGSTTMLSPYALENCTLGSRNMQHNGNSPQTLYWDDSKTHTIVNCAILPNNRYYVQNKGAILCTNCLVMSEQIGSNLKRENSYNTIFTNDTGAVLEAKTYRPVLGSFAGIDVGDAAYSSNALGDKDIYDTPRILNGQIDIGAVEYDWRPTFNAELGRRFTMTYASPTVTTNETGGVKLEGDVGALGDRALPVCIAGTVNEAGPYAFTFALSGGSAAVYVGGVLAGECSGSGEQSIRFDVPDAAVEIRFVFTPDAENPGAAVLRKFTGARGFSMTIR